MMIGAKIMLNAGMGSARAGLAGLACTSWMMSLPRQPDTRGGHPAGRALPGAAAAVGDLTPPGAAGPRGVVVVVFGEVAAPTALCAELPVRWESLEPGDEFAVVLDGDITLAPGAGATPSMLTLAGVCRLPDALAAGGHDQARLRVTEAAREFITSVARAVTQCAAPGREREPAGPALSWVSELPGTL